MLNDAVVKSYAEKHNCSYALAYADCERISVGLPVKEHTSSVDEFGGEGSGNFGHGGRPGEIGGSSGEEKKPSWSPEKGDWDQSKKDTEILGSFKTERQQESYKKARKQGLTPNEAEDMVWSGRLGNDT